MRLICTFQHADVRERVRESAFGNYLLHNGIVSSVPRASLEQMCDEMPSCRVTQGLCRLLDLERASKLDIRLQTVLQAHLVDVHMQPPV